MIGARVLDELRFPLRTAAFVGLTFGMYGLLEVDTARSPAPAREQVLHQWMRRYGQALLALYGVEVRAGGAHVGAGRQYPGADARGRGRLFVMNHRSGMDVPITLALFEATILSRADLAGWPVIGVAARRTGILFVDRADKRSGAAVIQAMTVALARGRGVMVYPEGTTFAGDDVRLFRTGSFTAALRAGAEVVPVGLAYAGAEAAYVDESFLQHMKRVSRTRRTLAAVEVGEPIPAAGLEAAALRDAAQAAVQALVHRAREALGGA
jgi:1-acyl-sn-glycerol-3-phosphate acyltransferase